MLGETLIRLLEQAEHSEPPVRVPALLRIARVVSAVDRAEALRIFDMGCEALSPVEGEASQWLTAQARLVAAAVSPERMAAIPASVESRVGFHFDAEFMVRVRVEHGHAGAAIAYAMGREEISEFPIGMATKLPAQTPAGDPARAALLRRAAEAWRKRSTSRRPHVHHCFVTLLGGHWTLPAHDEARAIAHEIVAEAHRQTSQPMTATYDPEGSVRITNVGEHTLFQVWHVLLTLDRALVESLLESVRQEAEARWNEMKARRGGEAGRVGFGMAGDPKDFPYMQSLMDSEKDGDFERPLEYAIERYRQAALSDRPNRAST